MTWRVILTTFGVTFLAELGDKTQLAAITLSAQTRRPWEVFIGASMALVCVSAIGVAVGGVLGEYLPLVWIRRAAAVAFILIGVLILAFEPLELRSTARAFRCAPGAHVESLRFYQLLL